MPMLLQGCPCPTRSTNPWRAQHSAITQCSTRRCLSRPSASGSSSAGGTGGSASGDPIWSTEAALATLGLGNEATFDDIIAARHQLQSRNPSAGATYEQAYDHLLHSRLRQRLSGEIDVSLQVRYADAMPRHPPWSLSRTEGRGMSAPSSFRPSPSASPQQQAPAPQLGGTRGGARGGSLSPTLTLSPPKQQLATQQLVVYGALGAWAIVQALAEEPQAQLTDLGAVQLLLASAYSMYTLKEHKNMELARAVSFTVVALLLGNIVGSAVEGLIRVDIFPVGSFQSPGVLCSEFSIAGLLFCSLFLV